MYVLTSQCEINNLFASKEKCMKVVVRLQSQLRNEGVRTTQGSSIGNSYNFIFFNFTKTVMIQNSVIKAVFKAEHSLQVRLKWSETQMGRTDSKKLLSIVRVKV